MKIKLFYSYSHKDESDRDELAKHLTTLKNNGLIDEWHDKKIGAGDDWQKSINFEMENASIILLLFSADFIASTSCQKEVRKALELKSKKGVVFIPIILKKCAWQDVEGMSEILALPEDAQAISQWSDKDKAWYSIYEKIKEKVEAMRDKIEPDEIDDNHKTVLRKPIIKEEKPKTFIGNLYSRSELFNNISSENKFERVISLQKAKQRFECNSLNNLLGDADEQLFNQLKKTIHSESYSPHEAYYGKNYYVNCSINENKFENFFKKIISNDEVVLPRFYVGNRGCGKTFSQNIWLDKHISEFEKNKIFHVRCDVHKIYNLFKSKSVKKKELGIETYLDIQFLYIFLKYRSKEYNNKCKNKKGAESNLMKRIDNELDKKYSGFTNNNNKFEDLGDFLDQQSFHINHSEVNLRAKDRQYSYAVDLMKNVFLDGERTKEVENILKDYHNLANKLKEKKDIKN